jgi:hypothetical protein
MAQINPFQGPINYAVDVQSPFEAAIGGMKVGAAVADVQAQAQAREQAKTAQTELKTLFSNPNAKAADYARATAFLPKDQAESVRKSFEMLNTEQQQNRLSQSGQVYSAMQAGQPEVAKSLLQQQAEAYTASGRPDEAKAIDTYIKLIDLNPAGAKATVGLMLAGVPGGKEMLENIDKTLSTTRTEAQAPSKLREAVAVADKAVADATTAQATATNAAEKAAADAAKATADANAAKVKAQYAEKVELAGLEKTGWDVKNLKSQISDRSQRLNLDKQTTIATVAEKMATIQNKLNEIPADTRKLINESATLAATSKQSANQMNDLAKRIEGLGGYGAAARLGEFAKSTLGVEGYETSLRQEYTRLRNQAAIKSLPPGPATDKDIELALRGFPKETSDSKLVASFLRGMAKLQDIDSAVSNAKTDWLANNNGTLTRAKNTFIAGDYSAKPGETFNDFSQRVVGDVSKRYNPATQTPLVEQIPTDRTPRPAAAANNIRSQADAILRGGQ